MFLIRKAHPFPPAGFFFISPVFYFLDYLTVPFLIKIDIKQMIHVISCNILQPGFYPYYMIALLPFSVKLFY